MPDANDMELVRDYARQNSESAFAELVRRHINLVYSVVVRFTGNPGDAEDVTQAVFILLARKAASLSDRTVVRGWLYETTRLTAAGFLRGQKRRRSWEQEAFMESNLNAPDSGQLWRQLAPHLEAAMSRLAERDRTLLALRFYENKTGAEAAALMGIGAEAAHKRTARALEKLRSFFAKRGVDSTAAAIAENISAHSVQVAPVALAKSVTAVAVAKGAAASTSILTLIKGALKIMAWTKIKTAAVVGACIMLTAGTATTIIIVNKPKPVLGIPDNWSILSGNPDQWTWTNGAINGHSTSGDAILASARQYGDVTISAIVNATNRDADFALRMQDADNGYLICYVPDGTPWAADNGSHIQLRKRISGEESDVATFPRRGLPQSGKLTVVAKGPRSEVRWNDITVLKTNDSTFASGFIGVRVFGDLGKPSDATFSNLTFY